MRPGHFVNRVRLSGRRAIVLVGIGALISLGMTPATTAIPADIPFAKSDNVQLLANQPGSFFGMSFKDQHAFVTGPEGLTVFNIADAANPVRAGYLPLPHFENEDVDICGNTLLISNDRVTRDIGAVLYVVDITVAASPTIVGALPLGLTGTGRGSGHIATFVKNDCSQAWIDGGDLVEVVDLSNRAAPKSLGKFESVASLSDNFKVTHDTDVDGKFVTSVGGGGAAVYKLSSNPLAPTLQSSTSADGTNPSPFNDFILHNSEKRGSTLLITEEDYVDTDEVPPGGCRGQGKFETWSIGTGPGGITPLDTWETELNGAVFGGSPDSKAPVTINCSSHWFDEQKGIVSVGWYEQGTRFLDVHDPSNIRQIGYYIPSNGSTWAAYFSPTDPAGQIVYTTDAYRGLDVLKITRKPVLDDMPTITAPINDGWFDLTGTATGPLYSPSSAWGWSCPVTLAD